MRRERFFPLCLAVVAGWSLAGCGVEGTRAAALRDAPEEDARVRELFAAAQTVTLPAGTRLRVRSLSAVSTRGNRSGDPFTATLAEPLVVDGRTIAPKGAMARGVVAHADPGGRIKGVASLSVRITSVETASGPLAVVTNAVTRRARTTRRQDAWKIGAGSGFGAAIGAIASGGAGAAIGALAGGGAGTGLVLATRGKPAALPAESLLTFRLTEPATVTIVDSNPERAKL
jgi:hypothetical protein